MFESPQCLPIPVLVLQGTDSSRGIHHSTHPEHGSPSRCSKRHRGQVVVSSELTRFSQAPQYRPASPTDRPYSREWKLAAEDVATPPRPLFQIRSIKPATLTKKPSNKIQGAICGGLGLGGAERTGRNLRIRRRYARGNRRDHALQPNVRRNPDGDVLLHRTRLCFLCRRLDHYSRTVYAGRSARSAVGRLDAQDEPQLPQDGVTSWAADSHAGRRANQPLPELHRLRALAQSRRFAL